MTTQHPLAVEWRDKDTSMGRRAQLGWEMADELDRQQAEIGRLKARLAADHRFEQAPCPICDYSGPGYFQPETHPCAKAYHAADEARRRIATQADADNAARAALRSEP